jgi:phage terminase large subunit
MRRPAAYWHMLPEMSQARKAVWDAVNPRTGIRRIDEAFPREIIKRQRENEMFLELINGSTWQVVGSDNYQSLVGSPPAGLVFSEWALSDSASWAYLRPIIRDSDGWALFITTPRGRNHAHTFYQQARADENWFAEILPATKTNVFTKEALDEEKREYIAQYGADEGLAIFNQEYMCSFESPMSGSYYGSLMEQAEHDGRIGKVNFDPLVPVHTAWDLGFSDNTAIWLMQLVGKEIHAVDYIENSGVALNWYVAELEKRRNKHQCIWGSHILPHDAAAHELGSGRSRVEQLRSLGINPRVVPAQSVMDGISAVRTMLPAMWFDRDRCKRGIEALQQYRRSYDDKRKMYNDRPYHDWASNGADAMRYWAMANVRNMRKRDIVYPSLGIV